MNLTQSSFRRKVKYAQYAPVVRLSARHTSTSSDSQKTRPTSFQTSVDVSVVVPVYNEEGNVAALHAELLQALEITHKRFELIFVNDGSTDNTQRELETLSPITIVHLLNNSGQTTAMRAGIEQARGTYIVTMDGDGQNPPYEIPRMLRQLEQHPDLDVISGWRKHRHDTMSKRFASRCAYLLRQLFFQDKIYDAGCSLRVYRAAALAHLPLRGELHRFMLPMIQWNGFEIAELVVHHRSRHSGATKYTWKRAIRSIRDMTILSLWRAQKEESVSTWYSITLFTLGLATACFGLGVYSAFDTQFAIQSIAPVWASASAVLAAIGYLTWRLHVHAAFLFDTTSMLAVRVHRLSA